MSLGEVPVVRSHLLLAENEKMLLRSCSGARFPGFSACRHDQTQRTPKKQRGTTPGDNVHLMSHGGTDSLEIPKIPAEQYLNPDYCHC
jgi:hypothetical protein